MGPRDTDTHGVTLSVSTGSQSPAGAFLTERTLLAVSTAAGFRGPCPVPRHQVAETPELLGRVVEMEGGPATRSPTHG